MIDLLPPKIDGATDAEKVAQLTDYVNTLYSTLSNKFENIDITDLNYTFAEQHRHLGITGQAGGVYAVSKPEEAPKKQECNCPYKDFDLEAELDFLKVPTGGSGGSGGSGGEIDLSEIYKRFERDEGDLGSLASTSTKIYDESSESKQNYVKDLDWANLTGIVTMIKLLLGDNSTLKEDALKNATISKNREDINELKSRSGDFVKGSTVYDLDLKDKKGDYHRIGTWSRNTVGTVEIGIIKLDEIEYSGTIEFPDARFEDFATINTTIINSDGHLVFGGLDLIYEQFVGLGGDMYFMVDPNTGETTLTFKNPPNAEYIGGTFFYVATLRTD